MYPIQSTKQTNPYHKDNYPRIHKNKYSNQCKFKQTDNNSKYRGKQAYTILPKLQFDKVWCCLTRYTTEVIGKRWHWVLHKTDDPKCSFCANNQTIQLFNLRSTEQWSQAQIVKTLINNNILYNTLTNLKSLLIMSKHNHSHILHHTDDYKYITKL